MTLFQNLNQNSKKPINRILFTTLLGFSLILTLSACNTGDSNKTETPTVAVTGVSLDKTSSSINIGSSVQLSSTITPANPREPLKVIDFGLVLRIFS
jgi:uncharacterized protein YjdB